MSRFYQRKLNENHKFDIETFVNLFQPRTDEETNLFRQMAYLLYKYDPIYLRPFTDDDFKEAIALYADGTTEVKEILFAEMLKSTITKIQPNNIYLGMLVQIDKIPDDNFKTLVTHRLLYQGSEKAPPLLSCCVM